MFCDLFVLILHENYYHDELSIIMMMYLGIWFPCSECFLKDLCYWRIIMTEDAFKYYDDVLREFYVWI